VELSIVGVECLVILIIIFSVLMTFKELHNIFARVWMNHSM